MFEQMRNAAQISDVTRQTMELSMLDVHDSRITSELEVASFAVKESAEARAMGRLDISVEKLETAVEALVGAIVKLGRGQPVRTLPRFPRLLDRSAIDKDPLTIAFGKGYVGFVVFDSPDVKKVLSEKGLFPSDFIRAIVGVLLEDFMANGSGVRAATIANRLERTINQVQGGLSSKSWSLEGFRLVLPGKGTKGGVYRLEEINAKPNS
jgi:hypothetical protein